MRWLALNRYFRAALSETLLAAVFVCLLIVLLRNDACAQFLPSGCPGQWVQGGGGMMCLCPDGTYANMVGDRIVCPSRAQAQPQVGAYCSNGGTCGVGYTCSWMPGKCVPEGKVDCGEYFCQPGFKCSSAKCIAQDASDCGNRRYCNLGEKCARNGGCIPQDAVDCGTWRCNAGYKCASGNSCIPEANIDCGAGSNFSCRPGNKCSRDGKRCLAISDVDCGSFICTKGHACGSGETCVPIASGDNVRPAPVRQPKIEVRAPVKTNLDRVIEALRDIGAWIKDGATKPFPSVPGDVLMVLGGGVLGVALLLINGKRRSRREQVSTHEKPALLKAGRAPPGEPRVPSAVEPDDAYPHESPSEQRDVGASEPPRVHDDRAVHSNAGVKKSPWAATPTGPVVAPPAAASREPRQAHVERPRQQAFENSAPLVYREEGPADAVSPKPDQVSSHVPPNAGLLIASMVLGIIGGATGLLIALFGYTIVGAAGAISGQGSQAALVQLVIIASPIASIVGAAIVRIKPSAGAILMGGSILPLLYFFGFNSFTMLPVLLSGLGAALTFLAIGQAKSKPE